MWINGNFPAIAHDAVKRFHRIARITAWIQHTAIIHSIVRILQRYCVVEYRLCPRWSLFSVAPTQVALCGVKEDGAENRAKHSPITESLSLLF
jgi:hypothetical protein